MPSDPGYTRRQFVKGIAALTVTAGAAAGTGIGIWRAVSGDGDRDGARTVTGKAGQPTLDDFAANVIAGGPGRGGIPAIDEPDFVTASEADFLQEDDFVFGLVRGDEVRAYPQLVLVWHEIVNDDFGGQSVSVTYCPLTGSVVGFEGKSSDGRQLTFNTTGNLVNSNLLMFDKETDSEWPQLLGTAISGPEKGEALKEFPLVWSTWDRWRRAHPDTLVLSTDTGFGRPYGQDPYGSYTPLSGYYEGGGPIFPVMSETERFPPKRVVIGVKAGDSRLAVPKDRIERERVLPLDAGRTPLVAVWDEELATARIFVSRVGDRALLFQRGELRDESGSTWSAAGEALEGPLAGTRLSAVPFVDAMWFSWFAFFPETDVAA